MGKRAEGFDMSFCRKLFTEKSAQLFQYDLRGAVLSFGDAYAGKLMLM